MTILEDPAYAWVHEAKQITLAELRAATPPPPTPAPPVRPPAPTKGKQRPGLFTD